MTLYRVIGRDTGIPSLNDSALAGAAFGATVDLTLTAGVEAELIDAGLIEFVFSDAAQSGIELSIRDYSGLDAGGTTDVSTIINAAGAHASALAIAGGYPYATLGGFGRGKYGLTSQLLLRDRLRWDMDEATFVVLSDMATSGVFRAIETQSAPVAQGTGTTADTSKLVTGVSSITSWTEGDPITGTGIPANTRVDAVNVTTSVLTLTKAAIASGTVTLTRGATYYGSFRNMALIGGKIDPNGKAIGTGIRALWTENLLINETEFIHNRKVGDENWAFMVGGRDMVAINPRVTGGARVFEDGIHVLHGQRIRIVGPDIHSGDDSIVFGGEMTASLVTQADPIRGATVVGATCRSERGYVFSVYAPVPSAGALANGWTAADYGVTDVSCHGLTGYGAKLRNGGVLKALDVAAPAAGVSVINGIHLDGVAMTVGSNGHDGVDPRAVYIQSCNDVSVQGRISVAGEKPAGAAGELFRLAYVRDSRDVTLTVSSSQMGSSYGLDLARSPALTVSGGNLRYGAGSQFPINVVDCTDFKITDTRLLDVPNGTQGIAIITTGSQTCSGRIAGNTIAKAAGATTDRAIYVASDSFSHLSIESNDVSGCSAGVNSLPILLAGPSYIVRGNRGLSDIGAGVENGQAGLVAPTSNYTAAAGGLLTASRTYAMRCVPSKNLLIAKIAFIVTNAATADDACDVGIFTSTGATLLGSKGATTGLLNSLGLKVVTLPTPIVLAAGSTYYPALSTGTFGGTGASLLLFAFGATLETQLFGAGLGQLEAGFQAAHPLAAPLVIGSATSQGPLLALRES